MDYWLPWKAFLNENHCSQLVNIFIKWTPLTELRWAWEESLRVETSRIRLPSQQTWNPGDKPSLAEYPILPPAIAVLPPSYVLGLQARSLEDPTIPWTMFEQHRRRVMFPQRLCLSIGVVVSYRSTARIGMEPLGIRRLWKLNASHLE